MVQLACITRISLPWRGRQRAAPPTGAGCEPAGRCSGEGLERQLEKFLMRSDKKKSQRHGTCKPGVAGKKRKRRECFVCRIVIGSQASESDALLFVHQHVPSVCDDLENTLTRRSLGKPKYLEHRR